MNVLPLYSGNLYIVLTGNASHCNEARVIEGIKVGKNKTLILRGNI